MELGKEEGRLLLSSVTLPDLSSLDGSNGFTINGVAVFDRSGWSVSSAGDINGDGFDDIIIGAPHADPRGRPEAGKSYVVFGSAGGFDPALDLSTLNGSNGFVLNGIATRDKTGHSVSSAGDINGDGYADLLIGGYLGDTAGVRNAGQSYVVFGKAKGFAPAVELAALDGGNGFAIDGADPFDLSGIAVSSAGDVNGDGLDDFLIGAANASRDGIPNRGETYLVFGKTEGFGAVLDLADLRGTAGVVFLGTGAGDLSGFTVSSAGDFNGDGLHDILIGARHATVAGKAEAGKSYLLYGTRSSVPDVVTLSALNGNNGFIIQGENDGDLAAYVSSAGDFNGDGYDDIIIGARHADPGEKANAGKTYVVFGSAEGPGRFLDLSSLDGSNGFVLNGNETGGMSGWSAAGAGDINGDGLDDLIVGAFFASPGGIDDAGASYVVFGTATMQSASLDPAELDGSKGFVIPGVSRYEHSGSSVSSAGDINGDGYDDLLVGARDASPSGRSGAGATYVVFGNDFSAANTVKGTAGNDILDGGEGKDVLKGGAGNDILVYDPEDTRIDGGGGFLDTLALIGSGIDLDLTALSRTVSGIECIDLSGSGDNSLNLTAEALLAFSNDGNTLIVDGNAGDRVVVPDASAWSHEGKMGGYHFYMQGEALLMIEAGIEAIDIVGTPMPGTPQGETDILVV